VPCTSAQLATTASLSAHSYPAGSPVKVDVAVHNTGTTSCLLDTGPASIAVSTASGGVHSWGNTDCAATGTGPVLLPPGETHTATVTWDRYRSAAGCPAAVKTTTAGNGTYTVDVAVLGGKVAFPPNAAVFTLS
jgi:hypothetical protein